MERTRTNISRKFSIVYNVEFRSNKAIPVKKMKSLIRRIKPKAIKSDGGYLSEFGWYKIITKFKNIQVEEI